MAMVKAQQEADAAYNAAMEEYNAQVAEAEEALSAWSGIYALMNGRKRAARERQEAEQRERDKQLHDEAVAQLAEAAAQVADGTKRDGGNPSEAAAENGSVGLRNDGRGRTERGSDQRQGDLDKTEKINLSDEIDENGRQFVLTSEGELAFGEIGEDAGLTAAPILLSEGMITNPATNDGYGLVHIEARHGDQIRKAGYKSVVDFIENVARNYDVIKEGNLRNGHQTYRLQLTDKHNNTLMVELSGDGTYWNINTAGIFKTSYGKKNKEVYNRHTTAKQPVEAAETSQDAEQGDTQTSSSMNVPTSSDGKDINKQTTLQENGGKSSENKGETPLSEQIATASAEVDTEPTEAQKEAGNYKKGHVQVGTFDITIEQPQGSVRKGTDADGKKWESKMHNTYGYFRGTEGVDGDHIDVFLSNDIDGWNGRKVYVVDQYNPDGTFDEHKVMLGFNDMDEAKGDYLANYEKGWEDGRRIVVSATNLEDFEKWIDSSHRKTKPFAEYAEVKKETVANAPAKEETTEHEGIFKMAERIAKEGKAERGKKNEASADVKTNSTEARQKAKDGKPRLQKMDDSSVMDAEYFAAVERGDMEEAQRIVDEAAERAGYSVGSDYQGTSAFNGAAPYGNGYFLTKEERKEAWDNGDFEGESTLGDYIDNGVDGGNLEELTNNSSYRHADDMRKEAIENVRDAIENGRNTITMYRSVPSSVQEGKFRNGDWITPSRKYAEDNAEIHGWGKDYRIIEQKVSVDDVWFDGNDIAEWGYGREKDYVNDTDFAYKNTENNRKLLDVITRDDDGNIIPPSERFNRRKADERYQKGGTASRPTQAETALRDAVIDHLRENGMDVIDNDTEGQRVLDMVNGRGKLQMGDAPETFAERQKKAVENHGVVMPGLNETDVEVVKDIPRHRYTGGIAEATKQAVEKAKEKYAPGGKAKVLHYDNNGAEFDYVISGNAIEICLSPKHQAKSGNKGVHLALAEHLDEVINKSIEVEEHPDYIKDKDGKRGDEINPDGLMHRFYGVAIIDGVPCRVMTLMREDGRTEMDNGIHSYEVQKIEVLDKELPSTSNGVGKPINEISAYPLAKLLKGVEKAHDKGKNLLEESKKRLDNLREHRVYHGSGADFDAFDHSHMGEGEGAQAYGWGTYVTEVEGIGRTYAVQNTTKHNDALRALQHDIDAVSSQLDRHRDDLKYDEEQLKRANEWRAEAELDYELFQDKAEELKKKYGEASPEYKNHLFNDTYTDEMKRVQRSVKSIEETIQYRKDKIAELEKVLKDKQAEVDELPKKIPRNLYTVEIPEDNGKNYLDWNKPLPDGFDKEAVKERIMDDKRTKDELENGMMERDLSDGMDYAATGKDLYKAISLYMGDKSASEMLHDIGYVGIKYPVDNMRGGRSDGAKNYVIFNEKDLKITNHVRFFRTADGEAYGFTVGGRIYIDPRIATSETPIHEYAHLWATALRNGNPKEWRNVVGLMKGTPVWDEVKKRYPELETDDEIADEVIAAYSGRRGAERLREEAKETADGDGGVFEKAKAVGALQRVRAALGKFWRAVADFLHIHYTSAEEVADRVMKDLLDGIDPRKMGKGEDGVRFSAKQKRALETATWQQHDVEANQATVVSSAAGAKIVKNLDTLANTLEEKTSNRSKTFMGDVARALGASEKGSSSQYATFETVNGSVVTIRLANHNASSARFDNAGRDNAISIVITNRNNEGVSNDGNAHIVEFYYNKGKLTRADGKPLAEIVRSIKQALYSGEFKDTTGLAERQEVNGADVVRYQFIGEKGAGRADHAEEVTTRLDNLSVAREMEVAKKDAKAIKMATGWERGADGKWRYEIPDCKVSSTMDIGGKVVKRNEEDMLWTSGKLGDVVDAPELLAAYPELEQVRLETDEIMDDMPSNGEYNPRTNTITIHADELKYLNSILNHEIQHAIQHLEGFARGGNPADIDRGKANIREVFDKISNGLDDAAKLRGIPTENEWLQSLDGDAVKVMEKQLKAYQGKNFALTRVYVDNVGFNNHDKELLHAKLDQASGIIEKQRKELGGTEYMGNSFEAYRRLGGEVESRNVEKRMGMAAEERRASLAAETEDVSREDQIFLMDGGESDSYSLREADGEEDAGVKYRDDDGVVLSASEYAKLSYAIHTHNNFKIGEYNGEFTDNYYYIYTHHGDGDFTVECQIPIEGNEELIKRIQNGIGKRADGGTGRVASAVDGYWLGRNADNSNYASVEGRHWSDDGLEPVHIRQSSDNWRNNEKLGDGLSQSPSAEKEGIKGDTREAMAARAVELAGRLNTAVRIVRTDEEVAALPSARQRRMKGSFNPMTGEVTVVVPNNADVADVENTLLHEVVGHDGLRVLFPTGEKLGNALDELYRVSNQGIQQTIDRMAQKMYDAEVDRLRGKKRKAHEANGDAAASGHYYADMAEAHAEAGRKRGQFRREATEEYGAELAGRIGESGFEKMSADELTFWGKLKAMLQKALQKLLDGLKIPGKKKWGDKEWAFVLHEAYKRKKNGGRPTVFDAADTEVMRRKTGFGDTKFSDGKNAPNEPKPIGHSTFGSVYNQFKGKVLQAVKFLVNHESGDLLGVFHRNDIGDIDMVWGDEGGGLCHILNKHINDKDFPTVKDLVSRIEDIINKGEVDERHSNADKLVLVKDGYLVTIRKNVRENGKKIADKNWVLTAYNKDASATTKAPVDGIYGSTAVAPDTSSDAKIPTLLEINKIPDGKVSEDGLLYRKPYGGNSGYVGYSISRRGAEAKAEGRYPKTEFRKEYGITEPSLKALVEAGVIDGGEWHHTSSYGNRTAFYGWSDGNGAYHKATLPPMPKSRVAVDMPNARNTRLIVESVGEQRPFSNLHICERFTPIFSPSSSCVRLCWMRTFLIASPT